MPAVSIVLPTYRRPRYLSLAIQSVLDQSYPDFDLIIVDDASGDETPLVVQRFQDARIRYCLQQHAGRGAARNRGLGLATGDYIAFLDDDDLYLPHKLARQVDFLEEHREVDLVASGAYVIDEEGKIRGCWRTWEDQPKLTLERCLYGCPLLTCSVLLRRQVLTRLDHWFDPELERAEDTDFFLRLLATGSQMAWLPEVLSCYRIPRNPRKDAELDGQCSIRVLDKLFARGDLPDEITAQRARLYACRYLAAACRAYAFRAIPAAQDFLLRALSFQREVQDGVFPLAEMVASFADSFWVQDAVSYIRFVFDNLPTPLGRLRRERRTAMSALYMRRVFRASRAGNHPDLRDWLKGAWYYPPWLRNRGVWAILLRAVLGHLTARGRVTHAQSLVSTDR